MEKTNQGVKIKELRLKNFCKFTDVEVKFNNGVTHLVGMNGAGKTTIGLTAIWAGLKGIAERTKDGQLKGERFRFIGTGGASAKIDLILYDEVRKIEVRVTNKLTKQGSNIEIHPPKGINLGPDWINDLFNAAFISAKAFAELDPKNQALALGIDTSDYDAKIESIKAEYTDINRDFKKLGTMEPVEEVKPVDLHELYEEKNSRLEHNAKQDDLTRTRNKEKAVLTALELQMQTLKQQIKEAQESLASLPENKEYQNITEIQECIDAADEINEQAKAYDLYQNHIKAKEAVEAKLEANRKELVKAFKDRLAYIKGFDFGFKGLTVDEKGGLLLGDRRINQFSHGEREVIVARLRAKQNPALKTVFIDDSDVIDSPNLEKIVKELTDAGFQVIVSIVGDEAKGDNAILLRECKVVGDEQEEGEELI